MRKIKVNRWKTKLNDGTEVEESLLLAINVLLGQKEAQDIPKGIDKARLFGRIRKAFEKADETNELVVEEAEYGFLKDLIEKDIPATWFMNENLSKAFENFLEAKESQ